MPYRNKEDKNENGRNWKSKNSGYVREYNRQYRLNHKKEIAEYWKVYSKGYNPRKAEINRKTKQEFFLMYGNKCVCCGETYQEFLTLEHKQGQRGIRNKSGGIKAYRIALEEYRPDLYEILCMNCNFSKGKFGYCPHQL